MPEKHEALISQYLRNPDRFWGENTRQSDKLKRRLAFLSKQTGLAKRDLVKRVTALAIARRDRSSRNVYISNAGSSGSHWLEFMLAGLDNLLPVGEVYIPAAFWSRLRAVPQAERKICLDAVYIAHCGKVDEGMISAGMLNSAHHPTWKRFSAVDGNALKVLLLRDPADIVLSRTFRKSEYRQYVGGGNDDRVYLSRNIDYVRNFMSKIDRSEFDCVVRYEDLVDDPASVLRRVTSLLGLDVPEERLQKVVAGNQDGAVLPEVAALGRSSNLAKEAKDQYAESFRAEVEEKFADLQSS
jgi:hypothetical protein